MQVKDACTRDVISATGQQRIREAARLMQARRVGALVIVDRSTDRTVPIGILTDRDIALAVVAHGKDPDTMTVADLMTPNPVCCFEDSEISEAVKMMHSQGVRRLPVIDRQGHLSGILAMDDVHGALLASLQSLTLAFDPDPD